MLPTLTIARALLIESGTYNDPHYRSFVSEYDGQTQRMFQEIVGNVNRVSPSLLSGIAGQIIQPAAEAGGAILVPNGWDNRRFAFMIEVHSTNATGMVARQFITGWTDIPGATFSGAIAPDMRLFVNNIIKVVDQTGFGYNTSGGNATTVTEAAHLITAPGQIFTAYGMHAPAPMIEMLTPQDVVSAMIANQAASQFDQLFNLAPGVGTSMLRKSNRTNCLPSHYVSTTLNALSSAQVTDDDAMGGMIGRTTSDIYATACDTLQNPLTSTDPFLSFLTDRTSFAQFHSVQWSELRQIQPMLDADQITCIIFKKDQLMRNISQRGDSMEWTSSSLEAIIAYKLAFAIPSIMTGLMITDIGFTATSMTENHMPCFQHVARCDTFAKGVPQAPLLQRFMDRVLQEVFPDITQMGQVPINIVIDASLFEDIQMTIHIAGRHPTPFRLPLFADAHFCPMVTPNGSIIRDIATSMEQMSALVGYNSNPTQHHNMPHGVQPRSFTDFKAQQPTWSSGDAINTSRPSTCL